MQFGRLWTVATPFGVVRVERRSAADGPFDWSPATRERRERARAALIYEAEFSRSALELLRHLRVSVAGGGLELDPPGAPTESELRELKALVVFEIARERLEVDFVPELGSVGERKPREPELPPLSPAAPPAQDDSFIAVRLVDQRGNAVVGRDFTITLPDGTAHEGVTDADGWARVSGFQKDGNAQVCFPDFEEYDIQTRSGATREVIPVTGGDASDHFIELTFVKPNGTPIPSAKFSVTCDDGTVMESVTDKDGFAKIIGLTSKSTVVRWLKAAANG